MKTVALLLLAAAAHAQAPIARIKIDTDRRIGEVSPLVFGNFAEHLGRMIYGGIYEEGSPLSDQDGFRTDVMDAVRKMGVSILRYPGGNFASGYNWKDGIGPKDQRPVRPELAWNDIETNRFGTDEFLNYCRRIGAEPFICINAGLGTIDQAREWVEYTNEARHTYWADLRRKNGRDAPWKVTYWGLGNEIDGPWQLGHKSAGEYARFALEAAKAMRSVDGSIQLIASGSSNYGADADWAGWNRTVVNTLRDQIDYISLHTYIGNQQNDLERFLGQSQLNLDSYIDTTAAIIREARGGRPNVRPIWIAYDEWNVWYRAQNDKHLEEVYNFEDALAMGMFFNTFFRHADVVKMANLAQMVNVIAPMMTNKQGMFLQPTFFPIAEYGRQRGNLALNAFVASPTYTLGRAELPCLDVSTTYNSRDRAVFVNVLNRSRSLDIATRVESQEGALAKNVEVWQMNHPDLKATHTFGDDKKVVPLTKQLTAQIERNGMTYTFPAHSLTILKLRLE
jgi:alpha-N-arabinofuranosidase